MRRLTFGFSASSFGANMALRQNTLDYAESHPQAAQAALNAFYVDDCLMGADSYSNSSNLEGLMGADSYSYLEGLMGADSYSNSSNLEGLCYGSEHRVSRLF